MTTIGELIREHAPKIADTAELLDLIREHHPDVTPQQIAADRAAKPRQTSPKPTHSMPSALKQPQTAAGEP